MDLVDDDGYGALKQPRVVARIPREVISQIIRIDSQNTAEAFEPFQLEIIKRGDILLGNLGLACPRLVRHKDR